MEKRLSGTQTTDENRDFKEQQNLFTCNGCNEKFQKPLLATVSSDGLVETYYACPRCLSKISGLEHHESKEPNETLVSAENIARVAAKNEEGVKCTHFLGYLKQRSKGTAFPEECLTCSRAIECMLH
jgi:DNA-directed RNA polymerase subunit RPC12/RpoP